MFCSRCGQQVETSVKYCPNCGLDLTSMTQGGAAGAAATGAQPAADDSAAVREALKDEYELEKELGRGGMAIVYKARDKALEREVAVKVLPFSLSFDAEFVERFQREARTSAKLEHPNIIPIYRVGKSGRVIYFVMKFIRGKALSAVIEARGALPVPEIKRVLMEAGRALGYAHKHGIVHRDIKPDNIMFDELGQAIVTDFGIAKAQSGARLTGTGMSIGTPHYMSPEQARAQTLPHRPRAVRRRGQLLHRVQAHHGGASDATAGDGGAARHVRHRPAHDGQEARGPLPERRGAGCRAGSVGRRGCGDDGRRRDPAHRGDQDAGRGGGDCVAGDHAAAARLRFDGQAGVHCGR
jgi:serine/threonine protein kinase